MNNIINFNEALTARNIKPDYRAQFAAQVERMNAEKQDQTNRERLHELAGFYWGIEH